MATRAAEAERMKGKLSPLQEPRHDVLVGTLTNNNVTYSFHRSLLDMLGYDLGTVQRIRNYEGMRTGPLALETSRNALCNDLLNDPAAQWLFMVDADMGFAPDTLHRLLAIADPDDRPVVGGLCFSLREATTDGMAGMVTYPIPTIYQWVEDLDEFVSVDHYPVNTVIPAGATGGACILIHRSVVEKIAEKFGPHWFTRMDNAKGDKRGEDIAFCWRMRDMGIPLFIHTGIRTTHMKTVWLGESDFWSSRVAPYATERVDVIVPVLHRPENVPRLLDSLIATTGLATAWFVVEPGDEEEAAVVREHGGKVLEHAGTFAQKVNWAYDYLRIGGEAPPWVLLVGDDVRFRPGWIDAAQDVARRYGASVIGTNDLLNPRVTGGEHATHPMIRRSYIDEHGASWDGPGILCHEGYRHNFVDDEICMAAKMRGTFQPALASHVEHVHPLSGKVAADEVYRKGAESFDRDGNLYKERVRKALAEGRAAQTPLRVIGLEPAEPALAEA